MAKGKNKQPKKHSGKAHKEQIIASLSKSVEKATGMVFVNYQGLTNARIQELKKELQKTDAKMVVIKNTLLKRGIGISNFKFPIANLQLQGPTAAVLLNGDVVLPLKALVKAAKDTAVLQIKLGIIDGQITEAPMLEKLCTLPTREVLIAQLVGGMKAPIYGLHRSLTWNLQRFVMTLSAVAQQKT